MAFRIYYNDDDFQRLVTALQAAANDQTLTQQQRNSISTFLSAGISAYTTASFLAQNDPRATGDPACRNVLVNTNRTLADFLSTIQTLLAKDSVTGNLIRSYAIGLSKVLNDPSWFGAAEQL